MTRVLLSDLCRAEWIRNCVSGWTRRVRNGRTGAGNRLTDLRQEIHDGRGGRWKALCAIEKGVIDMDDGVLKGRVAEFKLRREATAGLVRMLEKDAAPTVPSIPRRSIGSWRQRPPF
jgi:hypothetical protein